MGDGTQVYCQLTKKMVRKVPFRFLKCVSKHFNVINMHFHSKIIIHFFFHDKKIQIQIFFLIMKNRQKKKKKQKKQLFICKKSDYS